MNCRKGNQNSLEKIEINMKNLKLFKIKVKSLISITKDDTFLHDSNNLKLLQISMVR